MTNPEVQKIFCDVGQIEVIRSIFPDGTINRIECPVLNPKNRNCREYAKNHGEFKSCAQLRINVERIREISCRKFRNDEDGSMTARWITLTDGTMLFSCDYRKEDGNCRDASLRFKIARSCPKPQE